MRTAEQHFDLQWFLVIDGSPLVATMEAGGHPGQLDADVLAALREWIAAGAPETADGAAPTTTSTSTTTAVAEAVLSWEDTFAASFVATAVPVMATAGVSVV